MGSKIRNRTRSGQTRWELRMEWLFLFQNYWSIILIIINNAEDKDIVCPHLSSYIKIVLIDKPRLFCVLLLYSYKL